MRTLPAVVGLLLSFAALSACITYDVIPLAEIPTRVAPGDRVLVQTHAGADLDLDVVAVDVAGGLLVGAEGQVPLADIARLERRELSWARTTAAVGGGVFVVLAALALSILIVFGTA